MNKQTDEQTTKKCNVTAYYSSFAVSATCFYRELIVSFLITDAAVTTSES